MTEAGTKPRRADGAAYMRWYRAKFRQRAVRSARVQLARSAALRRLAELHPVDMRRLYAEERRRVGLD